jgi:hypothetical protein
MNKDTLEETRRRAIQYRFADGVMEIAMGGMLFMLGLYFSFQAIYTGTPVGELLTGSFLVIFVGGWYGMHKLTENLKQRLTYPRSGYAAFREPQGNRGLRYASAAVAAALFAGGLAYFQVKAPPTINLMPVVFALLIAVIAGFLAFRTNLARFFALGLISLILGGLFAFLPIGNYLALGLYNTAMGFVLLGSGVVNLRYYLHANPVPAAAPESDQDGGDER